MGPRARGHFQRVESVIQLPDRELPGPRAPRRRRISLHLESGEEARHAAALGRQQRRRRGAQQERRLRHGHHAFDVDLAAIGRIETWLWTRKAPPYPYPIDRALAARGAALYKEYCAACHGASGEDFSGAEVGKVTPIENDRDRSLPPRLVHVRPRGEPVATLVRRRALPVCALPQDLRLREHAARRPLASRAVPAQRLGTDAARFARAHGEQAGTVSSAATTSSTR